MTIKVNFWIFSAVTHFELSTTLCLFHLSCNFLERLPDNRVFDKISLFKVDLLAVGFFLCTEKGKLANTNNLTYHITSQKTVIDQHSLYMRSCVSSLSGGQAYPAAGA